MADTHYQALYRKYRPHTFEDVVGRDPIVRTLKNQIIHERIGHSYLFCGTRGTGKTTIAKIFAKAVNCEHPVDGSPCGECPSCRAIAEDANLNVVEMDAASNNGVDDIRSIIEQVSYSPTQGRYRVFIIDEAHMLSGAAANALLKTLEEPPGYAIFILATTEPNKLPITILSRCQRYDFGRIPTSVIAQRIAVVCEREGLACEERAIRYIASLADGSVRDSLSILDQCNAFNYGNAVLTYEKTLEILGAVDSSVFSTLFEMVHTGDAPGALRILDGILSQGRELVQFVTDFIGYLRDVMLLKASEEAADTLDVSKENLDRMIADARNAEMTEIVRYIEVFSALTDQIRYSANRRVLTEAALIRLAEPAMQVVKTPEEALESLMERVRVLEEKLLAFQSMAGDGLVRPVVASVQPEQADAAPAPRKDPPKLPAAVPDEIRKVAGLWDKLVGAIPSDKHMLKGTLSRSKPSIGAGGELVIVFDMPVFEQFFSGESGEANREWLKKYLGEATGREIPIVYKSLDKGQKFSENYIDIRSAVRMDIVEEDDD